MNLKRILVKLVSVLGFVSVSLFCGIVDADSQENGQRTHDGLTIIKQTRSTEVHIGENVDWSSYTKYMLDAPKVNFRKDWQKKYNRTVKSAQSRVTDKDVARIKARVSEIAFELFNEALIDDGSLTPVNEADQSTLVFDIKIVNLDVTAPDVRSPNRTKTYVRSSGGGQLVLEVRDAVSGELFARWMDYRQDRETSYLKWATRSSNTADARRHIGAWADALVKGLDELLEGGE